MSDMFVKNDSGGAIGVTYEGGDADLLERILPLADYIEVTLESVAEYVDGAPRLNPEVMAEFRAIENDVAIVVHGVGLSIGSHDGWSPEYFPLLDAFLDQIKVAWHSEHLAYTQVDRQHLGIMLAMPKTEEALDLVCERVAEVQRRYQLPFLLEHVVRVVPEPDGDFTDAAFLNALTERTGCGLIFDPYNLECDAHNHRFDIPAFVDELNLESIREMHMACGVEHNGFLLDVHSQIPRSSTIALAKHVANKLRRPGLAVTYEFMPEAIPQLGCDAIARELQELRAMFGARR
jgi:uncharacterized protein (UPF0276 family)